MPPAPSLTLSVIFDPGGTDLVTRQERPLGCRNRAMSPIAVASASTVIALDAVRPGATAT
jgi:hypothetical protein